MMKKVRAFLLVVLSLAAGCPQGGLCANNPVVAADYSVVPLPSDIVAKGGGGFLLDSRCLIETAPDEAMHTNGLLLSRYLEELKDLKLEVIKTQKGEKAKGRIALRLSAKVTADEGYRLTVEKSGVVIEGRTAAGVFYGIQTLRKSLAAATPDESGAFLLPAVEINDAPRFGWRGMHLDVSRHFFNKDFVKQYIEMMVLHNMNRLHLHLTDDQGWRMEVKRFPLLTSVGGWRSYTTLGRNSSVSDRTPHGGFFTQEELREIVAYARQRHVEVIPEIDMPGHMLAALAAYPQLGCTGGPYAVEGHWGVFDDILCAGKEETFDFVTAVLSEVMDVFPSTYIHIGGDEAPRKRWKECPLCQQCIRREHLEAVEGQSAEARLQGYFTKRVEKFVNSRGRKLIGWDELLETGVDATATIMSWRGVSGGLVASEKGHDVIMAPVDYCYFNFYLTKDHDWGEPFAFDAVISLESTYGFDPAPETLSEAARRHVLGVQGNLWTEYIPFESQAQYQVLPRMGALAEVQWVAPGRKDYSQWRERQKGLLTVYDKYGWAWAPHLSEE